MYLHIINILCFIDICIRYFDRGYYGNGNITSNGISNSISNANSNTNTNRNGIKNYGIAFGLLSYRMSLFYHLMIYLLSIFIVSRYGSNLFGDRIIFMYGIIIGGFYNLLERIVLGYVFDYICLFGIGFNICDVIIVFNSILCVCW